MDQIILVGGRWSFEENRWVFFVDKSMGGRILGANHATSFNEFLRMVYEDFGLDERNYEVKLSYMLSKKVLSNLPLDTPPIVVGNCRQLRSFLEQFKNDKIRLCVEITEICLKNEDGEDANEVETQKCHVGVGKRERSESNKNETIDKDLEEDLEDADFEEDLGDGDSIFDYCDDPDGASSDDEEYGTRGGRLSDDEEAVESLPPKKRGYIPESAKLEMRSVDLAVGQCYATKEDLQTRLEILSVAHRFDYNVGRSTPTLLTVICWVEGCSWRVRATTMGDSPNFFIKTYIGKHSCSVTDRSTRTRRATYQVLGRLYKEFIGGVGPTVLPNHLADGITKRFRIKVEYWKAHRALKYARELVRGSFENGYEGLPTYLYMIRRANPGTLIKLEVDGQNRFKFLFLAFGASIHGFQFMRKVVVVDGTYLKGKYKGTLLIATTQDGNFNIFPIAFAVVDTENDESWEWFFTQLHRVIPDDEGLVIISDRHKSISNAVRKVYPLASRGICTYHLYKNILLKFKGGESFGLVKKAATAYRPLEFNQMYGQIEASYPALHDYLEKADVCLWTRVHFPGHRYNILTSNIAESINKVLSPARGYPIVELLDTIRSMLTRWFATRRKNAGLMTTTLTTAVEKLLQDKVDKAKLWNVQEINEEETEVTCGSSLHVVNLIAKSCTCLRFDKDRIPCVHAIAAAETKKQSRVDLAHVYFQTHYLFNGYSQSVMPRDIALPVPENVTAKVCNPPEVREPPGRPKLSRIKNALEIAMERKRPRKEHKCSNCLHPGHNRATCKA